MANYYFLGTLLPELNIDAHPEINFRELEQLLKDNLTAADYEQTQSIRNLYNILNLRSYWKGEPFDPLGNINETEIEETLATRTMLPPYVFEFLDKYESKDERLQHFQELLSLFFQNEIKKDRGFMKAYLQMEREIRLVLVAFRARKLGRDLFKELQYEDPEEDLIAQILAQKDSPQYIPPEKYGDLKDIFFHYQDDPLELNKSLIVYRINKIEEMLGIDMFSIDRILGYMIELILVETWQRLDKQKGLEIVDSMFKEKS